LITEFFRSITDVVGRDSVEIRRIVRGATGNFFINLLGSLISLVSNILVAKYFGASILGVVALIGALTSLTALFANFGLSGAIVRLIPQYSIEGGSNAAYSIYRKSLGIRLLFMILIVIVYYLSLPYIEKYFFVNLDFDVHIILLMTGILVFGGSLYGFYLQTIRALQQIDAYNFLEVAPRVVFLLSILVVLGMNYKPVDAVYAKIIGEIVTLILSGVVMTLVWRRLAPSRNIDTNLSSRQILKVSLPFFAASALNVVMAQADILMLGSLADSKEVGIYLVAGPMIAELYYGEKTEQLKRLMKQLVYLLAVSMFPIFILLVTLGKVILEFFGTEFMAGYWTLVILAISVTSVAFFGLSGLLLSMTGHQGKMSWFAFYAMLLNVGLNLFMIPLFGSFGAALATLASTLLWNILAAIYIYRRFGYTVSLLKLKV